MSKCTCDSLKNWEKNVLYLDFTRFADLRRNCFCDVRGGSRGSDAHLLWYSDVSIFEPALHMS